MDRLSLRVTFWPEVKLLEGRLLLVNVWHCKTILPAHTGSEKMQHTARTNNGFSIGLSMRLLPQETKRNNLAGNSTLPG